MRALWLLAGVLLCFGVAQGQEPEGTDPAAVAKWYLGACEKWDVEAAAKALGADEARVFEKAMSEAPAGEVEAGLKELLCLPLVKGTSYALGEVVTTGDECRVKVTVTYTVPATMVLKKGADRKWVVDLVETITSTTGASEPMIIRMGAEAEQTDCLSNVKQICMGILCYAQDHKALPHADKWMDEIYPYMMNWETFKCPSAPELEYGYAFNEALSGVALGKVNNPGQDIIVFESAAGTKNAHGKPEEMARRHNDGGNVGYVDGHAKWVQGN